jgi:hypothetical protein
VCAGEDRLWGGEEGSVKEDSSSFFFSVQVGLPTPPLANNLVVCRLLMMAEWPGAFIGGCLSYSFSKSNRNPKKKKDLLHLARFPHQFLTWDIVSHFTP